MTNSHQPDRGAYPQRKPLRHPTYDYTRGGAYFVTIVAAGRRCMFGEFVDGKIALYAVGEAIAREWLRCAVVREEIRLDEFVVMPNHVHGIVWITEPAAGRLPSAPTTSRERSWERSLSAMIRGFKAQATKRVNELCGTAHTVLWQRGYYDHVIRNERDLYNARKYIQENPLRWALDRENPHRTP